MDDYLGQTTAGIRPYLQTMQRDVSHDCSKTDGLVSGIWCWFHNVADNNFVMNFQIYYGRLLLDFDGTCHSLASVEI